MTPFPFGWKAIRTSPDYSRQAVFFRDQYNAGRADLWVSFWDGINWDDGAGAPFADAFNVSNPLAGTESSNNRSFDAAYEAMSGRLLVVARVQHDPDGSLLGVGWKLLGRQLRGQGLVPGSGFFTWLKLASIPGTNKVAFIGITSTGAGRPPSGTGTPTSGGAGGGHGGFNVSGDGVAIDVVRAGQNAGEVVALGALGTRIVTRLPHRHRRTRLVGHDHHGISASSLNSACASPGTR